MIKILANDGIDSTGKKMLEKAVLLQLKEKYTLKITTSIFLISPPNTIYPAKQFILFMAQILRLEILLKHPMMVILNLIIYKKENIESMY